jgi:hypothetical protein
LLVPPEAAGACELRVGGEAARRWAEGAVLLFDDSFEHEVLVWGKPSSEGLLRWENRTSEVNL